MLKLMGKKTFTFYAQNFYFSKPMFLSVRNPHILKGSEEAPKGCEEARASLHEKV